MRRPVNLHKRAQPQKVEPEDPDYLLNDDGWRSIGVQLPLPQNWSIAVNKIDGLEAFTGYGPTVSSCRVEYPVTDSSQGRGVERFDAARLMDSNGGHFTIGVNFDAQPNFAFQSCILGIIRIGRRRID